VIAYFDSSALVKLVVNEAESESLVDHLSRPMTALTSALSVAEVTRALRRAPVTRDDIDAALVGLHLIEVTRPILDRAGWVAGERLRALDAIHLASALSLGIPDLQFISYDDRLAEAARGQGLRVVQPGR